MNDKLNPFPRVNSPLFFPEDPEFGFSSGTSETSRRKFLKRTGGATMATALSWFSAHRAHASVEPDSVLVPSSFGHRLRALKFGNSDISQLKDPVNIVSSTADWWTPPKKTSPVKVRKILEIFIEHDDDGSDDEGWHITAKNQATVAVAEWAEYESGQDVWVKFSQNWWDSYRGIGLRDQHEVQVSVTKTVSEKSGGITSSVNSGASSSGENSITITIAWPSSDRFTAKYERKGEDGYGETHLGDGGQGIDVPFLLRDTYDE